MTQTPRTFVKDLVLPKRATPSPVGRRIAAAAPTWEHLRYLFIGMILTLLWITPNPSATSFRDDPTAGRDGTIVIQLVWIAILFFGIFASTDRWSVIRKQFDVTIIALVAWCFMTTIFALVPDVSVRRLLFTLVCMMLICLAVAGIKNLDAFIWILLGMLITETLTKYFFVFALPQLGKHLATGAEPQLAGLWKGQYAHKNAAGPVCAIELMVLYASRRAISPFFLAPLVVAQGIFFVESGSKTPLVLFLGMVLLSKFLLRLRSGLTILLVVLAGLALLNFVTLASVVSDDARLLATKLIGDASFTGRVEVWRFLMHYSSTAPWIGAGFQSFWQIGNLSPAVSEGGNWVVAAVYGHQGFLDTIVMIGYPGLVLLLAFVAARPAFDLALVRRRHSPILEMFVSFWVFGLFTNGTESVFLGRADATWIFCIAGIVGIRRFAMEDAQMMGASAAKEQPDSRRWALRTQRALKSPDIA